jgi:TonB-dependent starch-binding outer membrane protein SusC
VATAPGISASAAPGTGTISGSVTDSITKETVPGVAISVLETQQTAKSNGQGQYVIVGVAPGQYHVKAMRVGFIVKTRAVEVRDGSASTVNFALNRPATELDEVVTTGVGDERRFTLGNEVSSINVDSLTPTAPVTSVTDVLTARVPGLQVIETGGLTGSGESIRIWGQSSALMQSDPIIIVDGVRQDNTPGGGHESVDEDSTTGASAAGQVDVMFRERAFWLYGTGTRLGDMRRLIRQYQRDANAVIPTYGTDVSVMIPTQGSGQTPNPYYKGCLSPPSTA